MEVEYYLAAAQHSPLTMVTMVAVAVAVDEQWQQWQCRPSVGGARWRPLEECVPWTPILSAKSGLREFLYRVYDVTFFVFEEEKCHICCKFDYSKFEVGLNGHRTFSQKHEI